MGRFTFFRNRGYGVLDTERKGVRGRFEDLCRAWRKSPKNSKTLKSSGEGFEGNTGRAVPRDENEMRQRAQELLDEVKGLSAEDFEKEVPSRARCALELALLSIVKTGPGTGESEDTSDRGSATERIQPPIVDGVSYSAAPGSWRTRGASWSEAAMYWTGVWMDLSTVHSVSACFTPEIAAEVLQHLPVRSSESGAGDSNLEDVQSQFDFRSLQPGLEKILCRSQYKSLLHAIRHFGLTPALSDLAVAVAESVSEIVEEGDADCGWSADEKRTTPVAGFVRDPLK